MAKTEDNIKSENKKALAEISLEDLDMFLNESDGDYKRRRKLLIKHYDDAISDSKTAAYSRTDLLDRAMGKPKQQVDMTTKGESLNKEIDLTKLNDAELLSLAELTNKAASK